MVAATKAAENGHKLVTFGELVALPLPHEDVPIPELGVTVRMHALNGTDRTRLRDIARRANAPDAPDELDLEYACELVAACMDDADKEAVAKLPASVIQRLFFVGLRMAGLGQQVIEAAVDSLKTTPSADSGSA